jgi:ATP-binding cassette subfamily G (WHITE) protein 2 (PDR)
MAVFCFLVWYYPVGLYRNAEWTDSVNIRGFHTLLIIVVTFLFASSLAHMLIAGSPSEEIAGAIATLLSIMLYAFCGILAGPSSLPRFWIFMYRVSCALTNNLTYTNFQQGESVYIPRVQLHVNDTRTSTSSLRHD